jgi:hypothetical protein
MKICGQPGTIRRAMTCHAGWLTDPMGTVASIRAEAAVSPTQAFSAISENRPLDESLGPARPGFAHVS